ncbi:MAG: uroporphyrinogen-III synthase [Gemmatimonadota bacterium]
MGERSLEGRVIVVTRPEAQAADLARPLEAKGARVVLFPTIEIVPPPDSAPLRRAVAEVGAYDWLVFTSVNGVEAFGRAMEDEGVFLDDAEAPSFPRVCAIGPATGSALEEIGLRPRVIPDEFVAEAVVEALDEETDLRGKRILLPRAAVARSALPDGLRARGAVVDVVEAYRTVPATGDPEELRELLQEGEIDLVTFTASSTVKNFHRALGDELEDGTGPGGGHGSGDAAREDGASGLSSDVRVPVAAIGPITAATARELGYDVVVVADEYTIPGLVSAVERYCAGRGPG